MLPDSERGFFTIIFSKYMTVCCFQSILARVPNMAPFLSCDSALPGGMDRKSRYYWPTPKCRKLGLAYATVEGAGTWSIRSSNSSRGAWK